jgi:hypothetical protein
MTAPHLVPRRFDWRAAPGAPADQPTEHHDAVLALEPPVVRDPQVLPPLRDIFPVGADLRASPVHPAVGKQSRGIPLDLVVEQPERVVELTPVEARKTPLDKPNPIRQGTNRSDSV